MPYYILCLSDCNILQYVEYGLVVKKRIYTLYNHKSKKLMCIIQVIKGPVIFMV